MTIDIENLLERSSPTNTRHAAATRTTATGGCLGCGLVDRVVPPDCLPKDQVVFLSLEAALVPKPLGHVRGFALLRLRNGTVWILGLPGKAWTQSRLPSAASALAGASAGTGADAERQIRQLPGLEGSAVDTPRLGARRCYQTCPNDIHDVRVCRPTLSCTADGARAANRIHGNPGHGLAGLTSARGNP
ncbi:hypothetical protein THIOKS1850013 [Thiocapsa sp. KS1]|nr:hypothetical protein THIOKS1850013 [Thiocapsa sp. KS1]